MKSGFYMRDGILKFIEFLIKCTYDETYYIEILVPMQKVCKRD